MIEFSVQHLRTRLRLLKLKLQRALVILRGLVGG